MGQGGVTMLRSRGARGRDSASGARGCNNAVEPCTELHQISEKLLAHRCIRDSPNSLKLSDVLEVNENDGEAHGQALLTLTKMYKTSYGFVRLLEHYKVIHGQAKFFLKHITHA